MCALKSEFVVFATGLTRERDNYVVKSEIISIDACLGALVREYKMKNGRIIEEGERKKKKTR